MYHKIFIVGHLGRDPEMRFTASGQTVTNFSVATSRQYTGSNGEQIKETIWFRVTTWGRQAETCNQYLHRGSKVLVEGRITPDPKTGNPKIFTRKDGSAGASFEVSATNVQFLSSKAEDEAFLAANPEEAENAGYADADNEDIPF